LKEPAKRNSAYNYDKERFTVIFLSGKPEGLPVKNLSMPENEISGQTGEKSARLAACLYGWIISALHGVARRLPGDGRRARLITLRIQTWSSL
jgi:hypothetical protein